jgi:hypothetical protein
MEMFEINGSLVRRGDIREVEHIVRMLDASER